MRDLVPHSAVEWTLVTVIAAGGVIAIGAAIVFWCRVFRGTVPLDAVRTRVELPLSEILAHRSGGVNIDTERSRTIISEIAVELGVKPGQLRLTDRFYVELSDDAHGWMAGTSADYVLSYLSQEHAKRYNLCMKREVTVSSIQDYLEVFA